MTPPPPQPPRRPWVRPGPPADPYRHHRLLTALLFLALVVPWIPAALEWRHYAQETSLLPRTPWSLAQLPLVWVFYAKTQMLLLPVTLPAALLVARGWWRSGCISFLAWTTLAFLAVEVDKQAFTRTHVHLREYAQFLRGPNAAEWAGNLTALRYLAVQALGVVLELSLAPLLLGLIAAAILWRRSPTRHAPRVLRALIVLLPLSVLAVAPAQWLGGDRAALQQLHALLPFDFRWSAPGVRFANTREFAAALNQHLAPTFASDWPAVFAGVPADAQARFDTGPRPNVILIVVESLRADALSPDVMPRLSALAAGGLTLADHSAAAKFSHYGLYGLLYARPALGYYATVGHDVPPQACVTFKNSGYATHYVSAADHRGWMSMDKMAGERTFDRMQLMLGGTWPGGDHRALKEVRRLATPPAPAAAAAPAAAPIESPCFITAFLVSTHFPYAYPPAFGTRAPVTAPDAPLIQMRPERDRAALVNRYHNACAFLDAEIADLIESLDLSRNLVIVTGDHGESFWDDGFLTHGGRYSDAQFRVPCVLIGAGIPAGGRVTRPTFHPDVLPTALHAAAGRPVPLRHVTGRDLLTAPPDPSAQILCAQSTENSSEFLVALTPGGRRLLFETRADRREILVNGTVDQSGKIDPFDVPPVAEAAEWSRALADLFRSLAGPR